MTKKNKKVFDPTKPLPNPKHEIIAIERSKGSNKVQAYSKAYPNAKYDTARANCSIIEQKGLDLRALHLLAEQGLTEGELFKSLIQCVKSSDERIKLDSTKFGLNLIGYGKDMSKAETSYNPVQINIVIQDDKTQPIDTTIDIDDAH